jgi:hypothetical protein
MRRKCSVRGCRDEAAAKGLCRRHYMAKRRTGSPTKVRKPGRKPSSWLAFYRAFFPQWSQRTIARYTAAMAMLGDEAAQAAAIQAASRPNGSINVSKLFDIAEWKAAQRAIAAMKEKQ